jgi:hypothetical protein
LQDGLYQSSVWALRFIAQLRDQNEEEQCSKVSVWHEETKKEFKASGFKAKDERI